MQEVAEGVSSGRIVETGALAAPRTEPRHL